MEDDCPELVNAADIAPADSASRLDEPQTIVHERPGMKVPVTIITGFLGTRLQPL